MWRVALDADAPSYRQYLSADERARAARFHFPQDRDRFIVGRGSLRAILGRYLDADPASLRFAYGRQGRPSLGGRHSALGLSFNLSHSRDLMLLAVSRWQLLGIDVEAIRENVDCLEVGSHMFAPEENRALAALPTARLREAFFACWTRKEAFIKARGDGLSHPLDSFVVSLAPGRPAALLETREDPEEAARWSLLALVPRPGTIAALAVRARGWRLHCWDSQSSAALQQ